MIRLNAQFILSKGYPTIGAALRTCGCHATTIRKFTNGNVIRLDPRVLTRMCNLLNCTPNHLFTLTTDPAHPLPESHALTKFIQKENINRLEAIEKLPKEKLDQIHQIIKTP